MPLYMSSAFARVLKYFLHPTLGSQTATGNFSVKTCKKLFKITLFLVLTILYIAREISFCYNSPVTFKFLPSFLLCSFFKGSLVRPKNTLQAMAKFAKCFTGCFFMLFYSVFLSLQFFASNSQKTSARNAPTIAWNDCL